MTAAIRVMGNAALVGYEEVRAQFTWKSWLFGWVARSAAQVLFYAAMGLAVGSEEFIPYAFLGNVVASAALMGLAVGPDTAAERFNGTLRREVLNAEWFSTVEQARTVIGIWLKQYNHIRPHQALNMRPPVPETLQEIGP